MVSVDMADKSQPHQGSQSVSLLGNIPISVSDTIDKMVGNGCRIRKQIPFSNFTAPRQEQAFNSVEAALLQGLKAFLTGIQL